jgi:hypothetical protein
MLRIQVGPPPRSQSAAPAPEASVPQPRPSPTQTTAVHPDARSVSTPPPAEDLRTAADAQADGMPPATVRPQPPPVRRAVPQPLGQQVPVTHAFDLKRRQDAIKRAQEIERAKVSGGSSEASAGAANPQPAPAAAAKAQPVVGRNDPCPCGSGKKYKKCHGVEA